MPLFTCTSCEFTETLRYQPEACSLCQRGVMVPYEQTLIDDAATLDAVCNPVMCNGGEPEGGPLESTNALNAVN